jgi:glycosyltransferase involved in cell wall biosynthesis
MPPRPKLPIKVLLVDPSLFTAPYDAALTDGLLEAGVAPMWAVRPIRAGDRQEIPARYVDDFFYRRTDSAHASGWRAAVKGLAHLGGLVALVARVFKHRADVVHVQWLVLPLFDALAIAVIRLFKPVVLTVHDSVPFNGERMSLLKRMGFHLPLRLANRLITHTQTGREHLISVGVPAAKIHVIAHGPLKLAHPVAARPATADAVAPYNVVLFGEIKPYKGLDLLVEAVGTLPSAIQDRLRIFVAGRPRMDLADILRRIAELGISRCFAFDLRRISEEEMAQLFSEADCFVFPYRQIDASGVYFLVKALGRWLIASRVGVFAEQMDGTDDGRLVTSGDVPQLAAALQEAVERRPQARAMASKDSWESIGHQTRQLYEELLLKTPPVAVTR